MTNKMLLDYQEMVNELKILSIIYTLLKNEYKEKIWTKIKSLKVKLDKMKAIIKGDKNEI